MNETELKMLLQAIFNTQIETYKMLLTIGELLAKKHDITKEEVSTVYKSVSNMQSILDVEAFMSLLTAEPVNGGNPA